jgi:hypothetical protein
MFVSVGCLVLNEAKQQIHLLRPELNHCLQASYFFRRYYHYKKLLHYSR